LGRAVIGGLVVATFATLFFVPTVFTILHRNSKTVHLPEEDDRQLNAPLQPQVLPA